MSRSAAVGRERPLFHSSAQALRRTERVFGRQYQLRLGVFALARQEQPAVIVLESELPEVAGWEIPHTLALGALYAADPGRDVPFGRQPTSG